MVIFGNCCAQQARNDYSSDQYGYTSCSVFKQSELSSKRAHHRAYCLRDSSLGGAQVARTTCHSLPSQTNRRQSVRRRGLTDALFRFRRKTSTPGSTRTREMFGGSTRCCATANRCDLGIGGRHSASTLVGSRLLPDPLGAGRASGLLRCRTSARVGQRR